MLNQFNQPVFRDRADQIAARACSGPSTRTGGIKFPAIIMGNVVRYGVPGMSPIDRRYEAFRRNVLDNKRRIGRKSFAFHEYAWRTLRKHIADRELIDAWKHSTAMKAAGFVFSKGMSTGPNGAWRKAP